jgi:hypothetical protein
MRNLTELTYLDLNSNSIGGMSVCTVVGIVVGCCVEAWSCAGVGITAAHTRDMAFESHMTWWCCVNSKGDGRGVDVGSQRA